MKIIFLGTGTSTGVPEIGCHCEVCCSTDPRDRRMRTSALIETEGKRILIDCGPDFRWQMITHDIDRLDAVLLTHEHYDHVGGLDDLRPLARDKSLDIYAEDYVVKAIEARIPYVFYAHKYPGVPNLDMHRISELPFEAAGIPVIPIRVMHGMQPILGYRLGNLAYLTDIKSIPEEEFNKLKDLEVLVIGALRKGIHYSHEGLEEALTNIERINPGRAYLIHMSHRIGLYVDAEKELPPHVHYAYDGLTVPL